MEKLFLSDPTRQCFKNVTSRIALPVCDILSHRDCTLTEIYRRLSRIDMLTSRNIMFQQILLGIELVIAKLMEARFFSESDVNVCRSLKAKALLS